MAPLLEGWAPSEFATGRCPDAIYLQLSLDAHQPSDCRIVLRTTGTTETAAMLLTLHKTIVATVSGVRSVTAALTPLPRKNQGSAVVRHLCATQGMSAVRSERVAGHYSTISALLESLRTDGKATVSTLQGLIGDMVRRRMKNAPNDGREQQGGTPTVFWDLGMHGIPEVNASNDRKPADDAAPPRRRRRCRHPACDVDPHPASPMPTEAEHPQSPTPTAM